MEPLVYHRNTCRLCDSPAVELALKLNPCPPVDAYVTRDRLHEAQQVFPIDLYLCRTCGHGQLLDVVSPKILFGNYIYTTSSSPGLIDYFRKYADALATKLKLASGASALDIGSNDGTLLSFWKAKGMRVLGVDPAEEIAKSATARGIETLPRFFNSTTAKEIRESRGPMNLVTANNVFAHSDALGDMADGVRTLLAPDGVFVFEVSYLLDMVEKMIFDFIYHEHLSHHSVKPLQTFLKRHGLHLFDVERTPSKGGTIRCFAQLAGGPRPEAPSVAELITLEEKYGLYDLETYRQYATRIDSLKNQLHQRLKEIKGRGQKAAGYGAAATSTVLIYHFDLGNAFEYIIDDNPDRQNRFSPGHHIPIVSSDVLLKDKPSHVVILVWRFADMIMQRNQAYQKQGGKFIIPLPEFKEV